MTRKSELLSAQYSWSNNIPQGKKIHGILLAE